MLLFAVMSNAAAADGGILVVCVLMKVSALRADVSAATDQHRQQEHEQGSDCVGGTVQ